jgi:hypothetical protein
VFRGFGAGSGSTGWYTLNTASTSVSITPIVAFLQQAQIANMTLFSAVSLLVGSLGTQDYNNVNITGGNINGVTITNSNIAVNSGGTGATSLTPNSVLTAGSMSTGSVVQVRPETNGNVLASTAGATVNASALVEGVQYTILTVGGTPTNWTSIGAAAATVGTVFVKNSTAATGNGTATTNVWTSTPVPIAAGSVGPAQLSGQQTGAQPVYGVRAYFYINLNLVATASTALTVGQQYVIWVAGTANWTSVGAASNALGTIFTATGTSTSTGTGSTAIPVRSRGFDNWQVTVSQNTARFTFSAGATPPDALYAISCLAGQGGALRYSTETARTGSTFTITTGDDPTANDFYQMSAMVIY